MPTLHSRISLRAHTHPYKHEVRNVANAVHLRSAVCRAEDENGSRQNKRAAASEGTPAASNANGASSAKHERTQQRSFAIEDGEALESALADAEAQPSRQLGDQNTSLPSRLQQAPGVSGFPLRPGLESLDTELYEAELSSLNGGASAQPASPVPAAAARPPYVNLQSPSTPPSNTSAENTSSAASSASLGSAAAAPPSMRRSLSSLSNASSGRSASSSSRPAYRPRSALSLARRRMVAKYLPFKWQQALRRKAEDIPEQQFNYLLSTAVILGTAFASGASAYMLWPFAREVVNFIFSADAVEARVLQELTFETQYLAAISLVTAILFGNTFAFSFDRQRQIIQEMAEEIFALELLLQELFIDIPEPHLRWRVIKNIKRYIDDEIQARDIDSPFRVDGAIMGLFDALLTLRDEGRNITKLLVSVEMLAQANSRRGALAAALLPPLHWVMLGALCMLMMSAFLLFDSDFSNPVAENRTIFAVLSAMLVTILQVLRDISSPDDGLYSVRDAMETRLSYVRWQMDNILSDPTIKVSMLGKEEGAEAADESMDDPDNPESHSQPAWMKE